MSFSFNPFTGMLDIVIKKVIKLVDTQPAKEGAMRLNGSDIEVYFNGTWEVIHSV